MTDKGSYALILRCDHAQTITVGKLGDMRLRAGWYVYCGSAFGPGGVSARLRHHYRIASNPRWHLDYLRACCEPVEHWTTNDDANREHDWTAVLSALPGFSEPMTGFGSSDCRCATHLLFSAQRPDFAAFERSLLARHPAHPPVMRNASR